MKDQFKINYNNQVLLVEKETRIEESNFDDGQLADKYVTYNITLDAEFVAAIHIENGGFLDCEGSELMSFEEAFELSKVIETLPKVEASEEDMETEEDAESEEDEYIKTLIVELEDNDSEEFELEQDGDMLELYYDGELIATKDTDTECIDEFVDVSASLISHKFDVLEYHR
ncbi:hypothetical protein [Vibrio parahaemolyticus]|uniref:hypothetical protein n=1 Tax=Vibrio TaxID=662 RepID=UPI0023EC54BC|nr:hypothetical protein [Vibrio parahaemolyticus]EJE4166052.1 hypothetical protein [Vibrio parahaemolyticus]MDF4613240.1 hypothetical protein [Vibrio parahaemolyticus]MDF5032670.1 hypothetical protein [Vibrio parahaemolyticus]MDF5167788.1 hypothetical protein [Vibrio parahaemolyticus]WOO27074.1 hypothetical protein R1T29_12830 [Vibrio parahaemolyticus]